MSAHIEGKGKVRKTKSSLISFLFTYIERKGKVSVKTSEEHEEGSDEVVDSRAARIWRYCEPLSGGPSSNLLLVGFNLIPDKSLPTGVTIGEIEPDDHLNI